MSIQDTRLYYSDSYLLRFEAEVEGCKQVEDVYYVTCSRSAFYPTSGGQPHDTGFLGKARVQDVFVDENNEVVHVVDQPIPVGTRVEGTIDWKRRFDHMQQHCGQHILSACFEQDLNVDTVGFHMGTEIATIDLAVPELSRQDIQTMEEHANEIIWSNVKIDARFIQNEDLPHYRLRHAPKVDENIRIVSIGSFDDNACGGTHPRSTGEVGLIKLLKTEKSRQGLRVTFVCGNRALFDYRTKVSIIQALSLRTSTGQDELVENVEKLQSRLLNLQKSEDGLKRELALLRSQDYVKLAHMSASGVTYLVQNMEHITDVQELKTMAAAIAGRLKEVPFVIALLGQSGDRIHVIAHSSGAVDVNQWIKSFLSGVGGKGGGSVSSAQGSALIKAGEGIGIQSWQGILTRTLEGMI